MNVIKKSCAILCSVALAAGMIVPVSAVDETPAMRDMTTQEIVEDMGIGINLGNTFESCGSWINDSSVSNYEKAWGSPIITQEMIQGYADEGFGVLRVPVAWSNMMGDNYEINADYITRVKEVIDWAIDSGMYVIVNIHYDGGWWSGFSTDKDECMNRYETMWTQLCDAFGDESDYLMFESLNEEGCWDDIWNHYAGVNDSNKDDAKKAYDLLNEINQKFVDIVRNSGGNNAKRHLLIAGYATDVDLTCNELFEMPEDSENRCAVSVHYYTPSTFCVIDEDATWGKAQDTWGTDAEVLAMKQNMAKLKTRFVDNGVPVIIGETGVAVKNKTMEQIRNFLTQVVDEAYNAGMCPVLWDINYSEAEYHEKSVYNRTTCKMNDTELKANFEEILASEREYTPLPDDGTDSESSSDVSSESVSESEVDSTNDSSVASSSTDTSTSSTSASSASASSSKASSSSNTNPATGSAVAVSGAAVVCAALIVTARRKKK